MMPRRKRPAYANVLLDARRAGDHPSTVTVIYGNDWSVGPGVTRLAVKPGEALGLDWVCVAGLAVRVEIRTDDDIAEGRDCEALRLAAQIACETAAITIHEHGLEIELHVLANLCRALEGATGKFVWPSWWSEEIEKINGQNRKRWLDEATEQLARHCA